MKNVKKMSRLYLIAIIASACALPFVIMSQSRNSRDDEHENFDRVIQKNVREFIAQGQKTFRFDTSGDEAFWGDTLKLHQAIAGAKAGGIGSRCQST